MKNNKRKRGRPAMIDGEVDSATVVTQRTITETNNDGTTITRRVWVSLDTPKEKQTTVEKTPERPTFEFEPVYEPADMSTPQKVNKSQVSLKFK